MFVRDNNNAFGMKYVLKMEVSDYNGIKFLKNEVRKSRGRILTVFIIFKFKFVFKRYAKKRKTRTYEKPHKRHFLQV